MLLYHGSNVVVKNPRLIEQTRTLDFGNGFYLTTDLEQAKRWSKISSSRRESGILIVSVFEIDEVELSKLKILRFKSADIEWLKFVAMKRKSVIEENEYDVIIGPVANDTTMPVINMYLEGRYDENEALRRLLPQKLKDQYTFKTIEAINLLKFVEEIRL